ncbi:MAG: hypothetical protein R6X25_00875 [Candidatus Krumholzibacteriia bacterium]
MAALTALALAVASAPAGAVFENVTVNPRVRAMGDAGVAVADPAFAAYQNPAVLGATGHGVAAASYVRPYSLDFTDLLYAGGAIPLNERLGAIGLGLRHFVVDYQGVNLLQETAITASHGINLYQDIHSTVNLGYAVNVYRVEFAETVTGVDPGNDTTVGLDAALYVTLHERTRLGILARNLNTPTIGRNEEELQQRLNAGIAYEPYAGVITTFEIENQLGEDVQYHGGMEAEIVAGFRVRSGVMTGPSKLTGGFGYTRAGFSVDYGFSTGGGTLDSTHQFGLAYSFGGEQP